MIPRAFITEWRSVAPWQTNEQVEQDLLISRVLVDLFSDDIIQEHLAFRGGTALYKLYFTPAVRYSEDIDLIQIKPGPIGPVFDRIKAKLGYLGEPTRKQKNRNNVLLYRFNSEIPPIVRMRLKIEINCREHSSLFDLEHKSFRVNSRWFTGACEATTFQLEELLGSKMRALYQRKQGRDLFDLWYALTAADINTDKVIKAFEFFMNAVEARASRSQYEANLAAKMQDRQFLTDTTALLRPEVEYDIQQAHDLVMNELITKLR